MPINSRMDKLWYNYTMECIEQYKRTSNKLLNTTTWVNLKNMMNEKNLGTEENIPHDSIYVKF